MHINDWDDRFLSKFSPTDYVNNLKKAGAESTVLYAHSHVGLTNYPTQHGQMHRGLRGRDIFSEVAVACRREGIAVQLYFSLIFDTWAYRNHPDWRIRNYDGSGVADKSRYGVCCPNSPYRLYVKKMIEEFCRRLEFDGVRFDMTFWPTVCFCPWCRERFSKETGHELPTEINWEDSLWVTFVRKREDWLDEFAEMATRTVQGIRPDATVEHQASTMVLFWRFGVTYRLAESSTFLQGDFYGDIVQGSVARKVFYNLTRHRPAGFETSFCVTLNNHTARKPAEWIRCKAAAALADACAFVFIDAINPDGTMNSGVYDTMKSIYDEFRPYKPYLGGERCQDVVIYLSTESKFDPKDNGTCLVAGSGAQGNQEPSASMPHVDAVFETAAALMKHHIPFGIITKKNLDELGQYKTVVLPNVLMMDNDEVEAFRRYVYEGGTLYASKNTSLQRKDGSRPGDFMLGDVFGVSFLGETSESFTYISPSEEALGLFDGYDDTCPVGIDEKQIIVRAHADAKVWGKVVLPFSHPDDWQNFTSIHSNPPGRPTDHPAVVFNSFGRGKCVYVTASLEKYEIFRKIVVNIIRQLCPAPSFEAEAPPVVEITCFWQSEHKRHVVSALNFQMEQPNVPVRNVRIALRKENRRVSRIKKLPDSIALPYQEDSARVFFVIPELDVFGMYAVEYE